MYGALLCISAYGSDADPDCMICRIRNSAYMRKTRRHREVSLSPRPRVRGPVIREREFSMSRDGSQYYDQGLSFDPFRSVPICSVPFRSDMVVASVPKRSPCSLFILMRILSPSQRNDTRSRSAEIPIARAAGIWHVSYSRRDTPHVGTPKCAGERLLRSPSVWHE